MHLFGSYAHNVSLKMVCIKIPFVPSTSSSGSLVSLCVCSVVRWLIVYQFGIISLSCTDSVANTVRPSFDAGEMITLA